MGSSSFNCFSFKEIQLLYSKVQDMPIEMQNNDLNQPVIFCWFEKFSHCFKGVWNLTWL